MSSIYIPSQMVNMRVWDVNTLSWVAMTQPGTSEGGGGGLTNTELRAADVKVTLDGEIPHVIIDSMPAGGAGLTDNELRATPVIVSDNNLNNVKTAIGNSVDPTSLIAVAAKDVVTGEYAPLPLSNTGTKMPISASALPLPSGASTETTLAAVNTATGAQADAEAAGNGSVIAILKRIRTLLGGSLTVAGTVTSNVGTGTRAISAASLPLPTGASTETTLAALNTKTPALGQATMANSQPVVLASNQSAVPVSMAAASVVFWGRSSTFRTPGRAGTGGQKILSIYNTSGSAVTVSVKKVVVDLACTVVKAITVAPPIIRLWKVTVAPSNGTALTKNKIGGTGASAANVEVRGDTSADGTGSGTTLTATLPAGAIITQEYAPRFITGAGYEPADRIEYLGDSAVSLAAGEGVVLHLDYTLATQNPVTDMWITGVEWTEV